MRLQRTDDDQEFSQLGLILPEGLAAKFAAVGVPQAAECANLGFRPRLSFHLHGGTHRGSHPKLRATLKMPKAAPTSPPPRSPCPILSSSTRATSRPSAPGCSSPPGACPKGSVYGHATARTPLIEEPLKGPVYLRSSAHLLPDLVIALKGPASLPVEVDVVGRIDSVNGGIRTTFETVPDAPVSEFTLNMPGGRKDLLENSTELCAKANRATAKFTAQNGRRVTLRPAMQSACKGRGRRGGR